MTTTAHTAPMFDLRVDPQALRASVRDKYRHVATDPRGAFHFHTGRALARLLGYPGRLVDDLPEVAVESFAGVANPFSAGPLGEEDRLVDLGSGAGFDCFVAAQLVGPRGEVVGVDMTAEMLAKATAVAAELGLANVTFRRGILEDLPVDDGWADVVISNSVLNLVADKPRAPSVSISSGSSTSTKSRRTAMTWYGAASTRAANPASVIVQLTPRRSPSTGRRSTRPRASMRSTVWVRRLRDSARNSASCDMRSVRSAASESWTSRWYSLSASGRPASCARSSAS
jgi:SAM-dependent methyltransferase